MKTYGNDEIKEENGRNERKTQKWLKILIQKENEREQSKKNISSTGIEMRIQRMVKKADIN